MEGLRVVEYQPELAEDALKIRNAIFPPLTLEQWLQTTTMTGSLAYLGDEVVGCIPMDQRDFLAAPDKPIRVIFENAVGTREDMRSRGIGTAMIDAAREFLSDRIDVMMVYRGAERSDGYRFYVKSGHYDMIYLRRGVWESPSGTSEGVALGGLAEIAADAVGIHEAFAESFGSIAGFPPRCPGYQYRKLGGHIYQVLPQETLYWRTPVSGPLEAYCIGGVRTGTAHSDGTITIQEMASRSGEEAMQRVLSAVGAEAATRQGSVARVTSQDDPFRSLMRRMGFAEPVRHTMIMAQVIRPQALFEKVCTDLSLVADLKIKVWTPTRDYVLYEGPEARTEITIEGKDAEIYRMLCRRLDVQSAIEHDVISVQNGTADLAQRLGSALGFAPWVYHHLDYI